MFHVNALIVTGIAPMFAGLRVVWPGPAGYRDRALYADFWKIVQHYRIAAMSAVPTVYRTLTDVPVDADITSLRLPIVGAAPLPSAVREAFAARTGRRLLEGTGSPKPPAPPRSPRPVRNGPGRSAASCPDSRSRPSGPTVTDRGPTAPPARPGCW